MIHQGDCIEVMAGMDADSIDAIVTDPPYDLTGHRWDSLEQVPGHSASRQQGGFMGKRWDGTGIAFRPETWTAALRVVKPGAYLLSFGGTRTVHRMTCAIEDAGWVIRDVLVWGYAQGFPKSKASLKPAWEPIVLARKPGRSADLQIDAARIGFAGDADESEAKGKNRHADFGSGPVTGRVAIHDEKRDRGNYAAAGRWPANVVLTDPIFDGGWDGVVGGGEQTGGAATGYDWSESVNDNPTHVTRNIRSGIHHGDSGTYSRFFLVPKASRSDREPVMPGMLEERKRAILGQGIGGTDNLGVTRANTHPTVKPLDLMRHLVRLVTPPGGTVLDPFLGSGTTGIACELEGFDWIGIEREAEYVAIAEARLAYTQRGIGLAS